MKQFLYPRSRQFPFDETCERIVRALDVRAFQVPGFVVEFHDYGSGAQKLRHVSSVKSAQSAIDLGQHDVEITFRRVQGVLPGGRWNDVAAVHAVRVGKRSLTVFQDESGPTLCVYVGDDWETDRATCWSAFNARLNNKPRLCVQYSGRGRRRDQRAETLVWIEDHREYGPEGDEPRSFRTDEVMDDARRYLRAVVLPAIEDYPVAEVLADLSDPPMIPMPAVGPFFAYGSCQDALRIETGKKNPDALEPADQYGMSSRGLRLAPLGFARGPDLPEVAFDGFLWCGTTPNVSGEHVRGSADVIIKVTPRDARGIYVADHAAFEQRRARVFAELKGTRARFTDEEVNSFIRARASTIVPITEYRGDYVDPVYLVNRELDFNEVEVIGRRSA